MASSTNKRMSGVKRLLLSLGGVSLTLLLVNCHLFVPPQGWSKKWGPLVPHDTFPGDCSLCHIPDNWSVLKEDFAFDHEKETGHPLQGAHASAACLRCHNDRGPVQTYVARGCAGCHMDPHEGTFGLTCAVCHQEVNWRPEGLVAEHARTRFPLAGVHAVTACERCHAKAPVGDFMGAPTRCEHCHQQDLARIASPDHQANGWVANCERCHSQAGWKMAEFGHGFFPLNGGHSGLDCQQCHTSGNLDRIPADCISCHQADYQRAPNHVEIGFPQDCQQCHSINGWSAPPLNHRFPIEGPHQVSCSTCHLGSNTSNFTCLVCHEHSQSTMDEKHKEVNNYSPNGYTSAACFQCHPNGKH